MQACVCTFQPGKFKAGAGKGLNVTVYRPTDIQINKLNRSKGQENISGRQPGRLAGKRAGRQTHASRQADSQSDRQLADRRRDIQAADEEGIHTGTQ